MKSIDEMTSQELVSEYNRRSGQAPIKRFSDATTGRKRLAALMEKSQVVERKVEPGLVGVFGVRPTTNRAKLLRKLESAQPVKREVLCTLLYGSADKSKIGPLAMVMKGLAHAIKTKRLPYDLRCAKNAETKEVTYAIVAKR